MTGSSKIKCSWGEIKELVATVNPLLFNIIENDKQLKPNELYLLNYSYGQQIGDESFFYFPDNQKSTTMPFCMVLKNHFEMYMELNHNVSPWKIYEPGQIFPYTKFFKKNFLYEPSDILKMTAGLRSSFMLLNKFSDKKKHMLLKKNFQIKSDPPDALSDQFRIFKEICDNTKLDWSATLLAFPAIWEEKANKSTEFMSYLNSIANEDHLFKRNTLLYEYLLNTIILQKKITSNNFVKNLIKYLLYVACGDQPAYLPSLCEKNAPIAFLREVYTNVYKSEAIPIFMTSHKLVPFESKESVYYSLNKDDFIFKPTQISNLSKLSQEIKHAFENICLEFKHLNVAKNTLMYQCASNISLDIIHRLNLGEESKCSKKSVLFNDSNIQNQNIEHLELPLNSRFLSACFSLKYIRHYELNTD